MYNGYKNYATWSVLNYISTDEAAYDHYQKAFKANGNDVKALAQVLQADFKAEKVIDANSSTLNALYRDILEDSISEIDFDEVAEAFAD